jgi:3-hydroxypropanoate dehydrogenase
MSTALDDTALATLFLTARTANAWAGKDVTEDQIHRLYDLVRMGPTSANCCPARFRFLKSAEARDRLATTMSSSNAKKVRAAPVTVIIGYDEAFYDKLPELFPHVDARPWFTSSKEMAHETAFRNSTLQGAYLILAARAIGLDVGPMSGFDAAMVDELFFAGTTTRVNFVVSLGYADPSGTYDRLPRLAFEDAARIL